MSLHSQSIIRIWRGPSLAFTILLLEIPIVYGIVSRTSAGEISLAVLGAALAILLIVHSPALAFAATSAVLVKGVQSFFRMRFLSFSIGVILSTILALVAFTSLGHFIITTLLGIPPTMVKTIQLTVLIFASASPAVSLRRFYQGVLIRLKKTEHVPFASLARLFATISLAFLFLKLTSWPGYIVGATALSAGAWVEALILQMIIADRKNDLPSEDTPFSMSSFIGFYLPASGKILIECLYFPLIISGISRSMGAETSLIAWPVMFGLISIFGSASQELETITVSIEQAAPAQDQLGEFAIKLGIILSVIWMLLAVNPTVMKAIYSTFGLTDSALALAVTFHIWATPIPFFLSIRNWLRGRLVVWSYPWTVQVTSLLSIVGMIIVLYTGVTIQIVGVPLGILSFGVCAALDIVLVWMTICLCPLQKIQRQNHRLFPIF